MMDFLTFVFSLICIAVGFFTGYLAVLGALEWSRCRIARYRELGGWSLGNKKEASK